MLLIVLFFLSLSSLFYEVLLARFFSISQWNHLSFMVISIALLGFAASGIFCNLISLKIKNWDKVLTQNKWVMRITLLFSLSSFFSYIIANLMPLDFFRIPFEFIQVVFLIITFILFSLPFFFSGLVSALAYSSFPEKSGLIYFVSMTGSTCGAVLPILCLPLIGVGGCIFLAALIPIGILLVKGKLVLKIGAGALLVCLIFLIFSHNFWSFLSVKPSPYKNLPQLLQRPDTKVLETDETIRGKIELVSCPSIRFAPGLSLKYRGELPNQHAIIIDADLQLTLYKIDPDNLPDFPAYTLPFSGYIFKDKLKNVLIAQKGGGVAVLSPLLKGAEKIILLEEHPGISKKIADWYMAGNLEVCASNPREYLSRSFLEFDVIQIENWGSSLPGMLSLDEEYSYTIEAFREYFSFLSEDGIIIVSRKLLLPPSDSLRMILGFLNALNLERIENPEEHLVMLRSWDIYTLLVFRRPLKGEKLGVIKDFARRKNFDFLFLNGINASDTGRFIISEESSHFNAIKNILNQKHSKEDFIKRYYLNVTPQKDDKPYYNSYIKWLKLGDFYKSTGKRYYSLMLSGEIIIWIIFTVSAVISFIFLVLPLFLIPKKKHVFNFSKILYFLGIGSGFMFVEIAFIKEYIFLTGNPVLSFSFVLCLVLVFSGIGGFLSSLLNIRVKKIIFITLICILIIFFFFMNNIIHSLIKLPAFVRYICMVLMILPPGILMGLPFASGMKNLLESPLDRAYSWAANGCSSVLSSILAVPIAMGSGISYLFLIGGIAYSFALLVFFVRFANSK